MPAGHPFHRRVLTCTPGLLWAVSLLFSSGGCVVDDPDDPALEESDAWVDAQEDALQTKSIPQLSPDANENKPMSTYSACMYLRDSDTWTSYKSYGATFGLGPISLATIVSSQLNRTAPLITSARAPMTPSGTYKYGFEWESGDQSVQYWIPQGMTQGSVNNIYVALTSWYYAKDVPNPDNSPPASPNTSKGVRIAFNNISQTIEGQASSYRLALLVTPTGTGTYAPVVNHAGGLFWTGSYLYVADTNTGVRVFDLANIREMSSDSTCSTRLGKVNGIWCAYGYKYVIPELSRYKVTRSDGSSLPSSDKCFAKFSWLGKDSTQTSPVMLSGEYCNDSDAPCTADPSSAPGMGGRLYRWPVDSATGKLRYSDTTLKLVKAEKAYTMNKRNIQGVAPVAQTSTLDDYRLASTRGYGALFLANLTDKWKEYDVGLGTWTYYPEGMHASGTGSGNLWVATEGRKNSSGSYYSSPKDGGRAVFAVNSNNMYQ